MKFTAGSLVGTGCVIALAFSAMQACSASDDDENSTTNGRTTTSAGGSGGSGAGLSVGGGLGVGGSGTGGAGGGCASVGSEATAELAPADIIIAVDTSGSMDLEAGWTQNEMNNLVNAITGSGIDAHVVMISSNDICVPGSLGTGSCPADENLPNYRHIVNGVGSTDALSKILNTYNIGPNQWKDSLRPNATLTFLVVSDDDSSMSASAFTSALLALDPNFQGFKFDAIVSDTEGIISCLNSGACCGIAADEGKVYKQLVTQTGGVFGDLCGQNFGPVFQDMATAIVMGSQISCDYDIPDPGMGTIDYDQVNVEFIPSPMAMPQPIYNVPGGAMDCGPGGGWYYDDPNMPTKILLCPATCTAVQGSTEGKVNVLFGCETLVGPPA
jgi:hypothetical protein